MQDLEGLAAAAAANSADKINELVPRANARLQEEIAELKQQLAQSKAQSSDDGKVHALEDELHSLQEDKETVSCDLFSVSHHADHVIACLSATTIAQAHSS